ncbi:MAG: DUF2993 domain-containing protein [Dactylosporangium sp.]|nr:DUF2993 domain-containing protein [Dactylosporangium sp.]NNJ63161.1 DUF2993 domain-containing protein [Dactylosporangium sp.]
MGRGRKLGSIAAVVVIVVLGGLLVADRIAVGVAEHRVAEQVKTELVVRDITTGGTPSVNIAGFPFLTQVMAGEYGKIKIRIGEASASGIRFDAIDLAVSTVRADTASLLRGSGTVTAATITGTATLGWDAVQQALEISGLPAIDLSTVELSVTDNVVNLRMPIVVYGKQLVLVADGTLQVQDGVIRLETTEVRAEGDTVGAVAQRVVARYGTLLNVEVNVPALPYRLTIRSVETRADGIIVIVSADNVVLAG